MAFAFAPALSAGFVDWDDQQTVVENRMLRAAPEEFFGWAFTTLHQGHYQPLSWCSLRLDLGADDPGAPQRMHRTNLVLHALTAWLFAMCAARLLSRATPEGGAALSACALFAALFWAVHPLRVESVAWITERRDVLSGVFFALALLAWLARDDGRSPRALYLVSLAALLLSLFAKAWGVVFPVLLLVLDAWPLARWREPTAARMTRGASWRRWAALVREKLPFFAVALPFAVVAGRAQAALPDAMPSLAVPSVLERVLQAGYGLVFYPWKTLVPVALVPLYPLPEQGLSLSEPRFFVPLLLVSIVIVALIALRRRVPGLAAACAAYAVVIAPVLGFTQAGPQLVADRYSYLATLPFALLAAAALGGLARMVAAGRIVAVALGLACLTALAMASRSQTRVWHDTDSLWTHTLRVDPDHAIAHLGLGNASMHAAFVAAGTDRDLALTLLRSAEEHYLRGFAVLADPRFPTKLALLNAARADLEPEQRDEHLARAKQFSSRAVELTLASGHVRPELRRAHATNLLALGEAAQAARLLDDYVREVPDDPLGWLQLARARDALGQRELAIEAAERALSLDSGNADARQLLEALR